MFGGIFKSKKKAEQARATEKKDSFYENDGDDGVAEGDESHMDDEEYGRRVSEEITKRKNNNVTKQTGSAAHKSSTPAVSSKVPPNAQAPPPSAQSAQKVSYPLPAGTAKSTVPAHGAVTSTTPKATPAASVPPVPSAQKAAVVPAKSTASMVPTAPASKPAPIAPVAVASSTSKPNSSTPSPQPMFVSPSSVAAARPNSATSAPVTPRVIATAAAAARPFPATAAPVIVPIDKNVPPLDPKAVQQLVLMGFSYPASMLALQKCNNKSDLAAEFLLEHSEEYINEILTTQAAGRPISPKPILPMPLPVSSTPKSAPVPQHSTPSPQIPSVGIPVTTSKNSTAVLSNPASATGATPPQWMETSNGDAASDKRAKPKEMQAVDTAMAAILAKREALKRQTPPPTPAVTSCLSSPRGGFGTDTSSTYGNGSVFEKLSSYKTKGAALHEQQEEEDRQRKEAQERRRKLLATPASASSNLSPKGAADEIDNQAFEALFNKKTKSMVMTEKQAEEERIAREAYERKWKKVTARDSLGSSNLTSDSEAEVFSKLHATKLKSHKISEQVEQEKKAHLQKVEAVSSGRLGASAPPTADAPLLRKTQSAMMREQFTLEDKQRLEEERAAVERKRREIEGSPVGRRKRGSSVERLHTSSGEDLADSIDRSLRIAARNSLTNSNIDIGDATLVEDEDSEDEGGNEESKPMPVEQTATKRTASSATMARQPSGRGTDFPKQSSFYTKRENMGKTKSFRTTGALGVPGVATRERLPQEVQETAEHLWVCKVVNAPRDGVSVTGRKAEIMVPVKGTYATKQQCQAIALANAPPRWATRVKNAVCGICEEAFNKYLKAENCSNCGQLVCADCSQENWPVSMVPDAFCDKKTVPRVCAACNVLMEKAVAALKAGDFDLVTVLHKTGNVNFHNQYSIFPDAPYAVSTVLSSSFLSP